VEAEAVAEGEGAAAEAAAGAEAVAEVEGAAAEAAAGAAERPS